jgi:hypothetical protein
VVRHDLPVAHARDVGEPQLNARAGRLRGALRSRERSRERPGEPPLNDDHIAGIVNGVDDRDRVWQRSLQCREVLAKRCKAVDRAHAGVRRFEILRERSDR